MLVEALRVAREASYLIRPKRAPFPAFNRSTSEKQVTIYPDFEHEDLPGVGDRILAFFVDRLGPAAELRRIC